MRARFMLPLPALLFLGACGFTPLYGTGKARADVSAELAQVYVSNIGGRYGQELRLALQKDLAGPGPENPQHYTLEVGSGMNEESIDIHSDNTAGRTRSSGSAHWRLFTVEQYPRLLAEGDATTLDGYNATFEQYFAQTLNEETLQARVADNLAQSVTQQVAIWFRSHVAPQKEAPADLPRYVNMDAMPADNGKENLDAVGPDGFPSSAIGHLPRRTSTSASPVDSDD